MDSTYKALLQYPEWVEKKTFVLQRDKYRCTECGRSKCMLHVHHKVYYEGKEPWMVEEKYLTTLCDACHAFIHIKMDVNSVKKGITPKSEYFKQRGKRGKDKVSKPEFTKRDLEKMRMQSLVRGFNEKQTKINDLYEKHRDAIGTKALPKPFHPGTNAGKKVGSNRSKDKVRKKKLSHKGPIRALLKEMEKFKKGKNK